MNRKLSYVVLFLLILLFLSGCVGMPKNALLSISADPNPVSYDSTVGKWSFSMTINESNGVGVTMSSMKIDKYNQEGELVDTDYYYEDTILDWFGSDYISAFSSVQANLRRSGNPTYDIFTVTGIDDNNNPVEATIRIDFLPQ